MTDQLQEQTSIQSERNNISFQSPLYYSPSQVYVFVNSILIDEARGIRYVVQDGNKPLYGYNDIHFRAVARGKTMLSGQLIINYKFNGYLTTTLNSPRITSLTQLGGGSKVSLDMPFGRIVDDLSLRDSRRKSFTSLLNSEAMADSTKVFDEVSDSFHNDNSGLEQWSSFLVDRFAADGRALSMESDLSWVDFNRVGASSIKHESRVHDIQIVYGSPSNIRNPRLTKTIHNVVFNGETQIIQAEVDSGPAIVEVYDFFAKDIT